MYNILIEDRAIIEIENAIEYYETKLVGLGYNFKIELSKSFDALSINPYYQIRYKNVRCKPLKKFPFLIHYTVNKANEIVEIYAVVCTHQNPEFEGFK
ncbi:MAG: type II toxin-antitoxin system RelE/ParE family toxin [Sphingobacteriales bacterium]|nr:MAG: type II toxin-antitoxin system RelE/ParE family toxin [Sphingobacteriales bacterium]